jgi:hypothetical protein
MLENLGNEWNLIVFHGTENKEWAQKKIEDELSIFKNRITLKNLNTPNLSYPDEYNKLLSSKEFYDNIPTELILIAQTDSMICSPNKDLLNKFLQYDYVGGPWKEDASFLRDSKGRVGNGGFSLRRKSKMLEIINKFPFILSNLNDDLYYASHFLETNAKIPDPKEAEEFSVELVYSPKSFGIHSPWKYGVHITDEQCPGVRTLEELQGTE